MPAFRSFPFCLPLLALLASSRAAWAVEPASVQADTVSIAADDRVVEAVGNVRVDAEPFHLQSDALTLTRSWRGIEIEGSGKLSFCRCLSFPLALSFRDGAVGPPYDLVLNRVKLELFGAPLFYLPILWIRSPGRTGLLMPELAYRGRDGVYGSLGLHVPLSAGSLTEGLDVRVGGYARGGFASEARVRTEHTHLLVRLDSMRAFDTPSTGVAGTGLSVDARGSVGDGARVGWNADMLIGRRALFSTTALEAAARPFDRGRAEAAWVGRELALATGVRTLSTRGAGLDRDLTGGPYAQLGLRRAWFGSMLFDAIGEAGVLGRADAATLSYVRGEGGVFVSEHAGPFLAELRARGAGSGSSRGAGSGNAWLDGAASSEVSVGVPLARGFGTPAWPLRHRLEPKIGLRVLGARGDDALGVAAGRGLRAVRGEAAVAEASLLSSLGRLGSRGAWDFELAAGAVGTLSGTESSTQSVLRARQVLSFRYAALIAEGAVAGPSTGGGADRGAAIAAHGRLGARDRVSLRTRLFAETGLSPVAARLLVDPLREAPTAYVGREGVTGGAALRVPFTPWLAADGGADMDLSEHRLLGARAGIELRDRCGCFVVRLAGSQRLGRAGTDVWLSVDLMPAGKI